MFHLSLRLLILMLASCAKSQMYGNKMRNARYDYIIVGAGSAGATIANRLSEDKPSTVLLLEAGGLPTPESDVPLLVLTLQNTKLDWAYKTVPQTKSCWGHVEERAVWPRGKVLGGSSTINYMLYVRANHNDYNNWVKMGASGWSWDEVFPYFLKSEDQTDKSIALNGFHQVGGLLTVSRAGASTIISDVLLESVKDIGYNVVDYNGPSQTGFSKIQGTLRKGARCSTEKAFLRPVASRTNLDILYEATVRKIQFDDKKRAKFIMFDHLGITHSILVKKEIILSAGVIGSPQILMLSGVGPKEHLEELKIPVIADLPVGQNLMDHLMAGGVYFQFNDSVSIVPERDVTGQTMKDFGKGKGLLTIPGALEVIGFVNSKYANVSQDWPDLQMLIVSNAFIPSSLKDSIKEKLSSLAGKDVIIILPQLNRPKSRGFVKLASTDPYEYPLINPKYLWEDDDVRILVDGLKIARSIAESKHMQRFDPILMPDVVPGCEIHASWSDDYLECMARTLSFTTFHPVGTCKMGDFWDPTTVVDPELKVKGVSGLRVVDGSVMPQIVSGNPNSPIIMIAEKAADMIRGYWWNHKTKMLRKEL